MFNTKTFQVLNLKKPYISISHKCALAIQHIVKIAPQEAQWFNVIESIEETSAGIKISLSEELYIPEQVCSVTEVNSDPNMMINFYRELSSKKTQEETNHILSNMTCWSHSHHNMGVFPSAQDQKQFLDFIKMNNSQNNNKSVLMLIFNKKQEVYSRFYDANTGIISENLDIFVDHCSLYDFTYISDAAKTKFKTPPPPKFKYPAHKSTSDFSKSAYGILANYDSKPSDSAYIIPNPDLPIQIIKSCLKLQSLPTISCSNYFDGSKARAFLANLADDLLPNELYIFIQLLLGNESKLTYKKLNGNSIPDLDLNPKATVFIDFIKFLKTSNVSFEYITNCLQESLTIADLADTDEQTFKMYMEN